MKIKVKIRRGGKLLKATDGSSGYDIFAASDVEIPPGQWRAVPTGVYLEIPEGFEAQVRPRSGLALKYGVTVLNAPGTIDSDYRGEVKVILINFGKAPFKVEKGMRIAQIVFSKVADVELEEVEKVSTTFRGEGGFGHTGL